MKISDFLSKNSTFLKIFLWFLLQKLVFLPKKRLFSKCREMPRGPDLLIWSRRCVFIYRTNIERDIWGTLGVFMVKMAKNCPKIAIFSYFWAFFMIFTIFDLPALTPLWKLNVFNDLWYIFSTFRYDRIPESPEKW